MVRRLPLAAVLISLLALDARAQGRLQLENTPENLKKFMELTYSKLHVEKNVRDGSILFRSLLPDEARMRKAFNDTVSSNVIGLTSKMYTDLLTAITDYTSLMQADQSVVAVHAATTEELIAYKPGTPAFEEFPAGAQAVAKVLLRPGMTFYEVEFLQPGKTAGVKYHLFFWDGRGWAMLGPIWRIAR